MTSLQLTLLGGLKARLESGEPVHVPARKSGALLAYLALPPGKAHPREQLMGLFWSQRSEGQARSSLRQALFSLRDTLRAVDPAPLVVDSETIALNPAAVATDVDHFERLAASSRPEDLEAAVTLYGGDLLAGVNVRDPAFEEWLFQEQQRLRTLALGALRTLLDHEAEAGVQRASDTAQRLLALDPLDEAVHRVVMRLHARQGQRALALRQYELCRDVLKRELGVEPEPETVELYDAILKERAKPKPAAQSAGGKGPAQRLDEEIPVDIPAGKRKAASVASRPSQDAAPRAGDERSITARPSIAVLPFTNMSGDPEQEYFSDGVTEDIITALARNRWLLVVSRHSTFVYKDKTVDVRQIANELGSRYLVEGSVRRLGDRVRVSAQLTDADTGKHLWTERYDQQIEDIFDVQEEIAQSIAAAIEPELGAIEGRRSRAKAPETLDAWDCYHQGLWHMYKFTVGGLAQAEALFERAIDLDPEFAPAYARLAYAHIQNVWYGPHESRDSYLGQALTAAKRAVELDERDAVGHFALGRAYVLHGQHDLGIAELETAIALNPSFAQAYFGLGQAFCFADRSEQGLPLFDTAIALSPHDPHLWTFFNVQGLANYRLGRLEDAESCFWRSARAPNVTYWTFANLASVLGNLNKTEEAGPIVDELLRRKPEYNCSFAKADFLFGRSRIFPMEFVEQYIAGLRKVGLPE
ncbi:MAG: BTAD domain-containing putative transcriptional regulator [Acidiferrobacterales bacterium]